MLKTYFIADRAFDEARGFSKTMARWANVDSESGVTAVEYGILAAMLVVVLVAAAATLGTSFSSGFAAIGSKMPQ